MDTEAQRSSSTALYCPTNPGICIDPLPAHIRGQTFRRQSQPVGESYTQWCVLHEPSCAIIARNMPTKNCPGRCKSGLVKSCNIQLSTIYYVVGSSRNSTGGLSNNSSAIDNRLRWPPERDPHFVFFV